MRGKTDKATIVPWVFAFAVILLCRVMAGSEGSAPTYDCGTLSLYTLLRVRGEHVGLQQVASALPSPSPLGFSMKELQTAAGKFGCPLEGVRLPRTRQAPERPLIALVSRGDHGHYIVLRPVGHTKRLVQVIDSAVAPIVIDAESLYLSPEWTGLALVPDPPNSAKHRLTVALILILCALAGLIKMRKRMRTREVVGKD